MSDEVVASAAVFAYVSEPVGVENPIGSSRFSVRPRSAVTMISAATTAPPRSTRNSEPK